MRAKGYMGSAQYTVHRQGPDVRKAPVVRKLAGVRTSGVLQTSVDLARVEGHRTSDGFRSSGRRSSIGSGLPQIRLGSSGAGRSGWTGRPVAVASGSFVSWYLYLASLLALPLDVVASWLSSKYLIMHRTHVGGSSHVSHVESEGSERSEFTLCPMAYS